MNRLSVLVLVALVAVAMGTPTAPTAANPTAPTAANPTAPTAANPTAPTAANPTAPTAANPTAPTAANPTAPAVPTNPATPAAPAAPPTAPTAPTAPAVPTNPATPAAPTATNPTAPTATNPTAPTATTPTAPTATTPTAPTATTPSTAATNNYTLSFTLDTNATYANSATFKATVQTQCIIDFKASNCIVGTFAGRKFTTAAVSATIQIVNSQLTASAAATKAANNYSIGNIKVTGASVVSGPSAPDAASMVTMAWWAVAAMVAAMIAF